MKRKVHTFDIWGCCVSRDSFGVPLDQGQGIQYPPRQKGVDEYLEKDSLDSSNIFRYQINNYIQGIPISVQYSPLYGPVISDDEDFPLQGAGKKWALESYNKSVIDLLDNSESEWLIVDFRSECYPRVLIEHFDGHIDYACGGGPSIEENKKIADYYLKKEWVKNAIVVYGPGYSEESIRRFSDFAKSRYGNRIIAIETREAFFRLNEEGKVIDSPPDEQRNQISSNALLKFYQFTGCHLIKCPYAICGDVYHKWGSSDVHYLSEYYNYVYQSICLIVSEVDNLPKKLDELYLKINSKIANIRSDHTVSLLNALRRAEKYLQSDNPELGVNILNKLVENGEPMAMVHLARVYKNGKYIEKDMAEAINLLKKACSFEMPWPAWDLSDIYYSKTETKCQALELLRQFESTQHPEILARLGNIYRDGAVVSRDYRLSEKYYRQAICGGIHWAKWELFDILFKNDSPEALSEAFELANSMSSHREMQGRLARMYRLGKGVCQNYVLAAEWMKKADDQGLSWAKWELCDILLKIGDVSSIKEAKQILHDNSDHREIQGRLGRAYRDGVIYNKDIERAICWMRKASNNGLQWAKYELIDLLIEEGSPQSLNEATDLVKSIPNVDSKDVLRWKKSLSF